VILPRPQGSSTQEAGSEAQKASYHRGLKFASATGEDCWQGQKYIAILNGLLQKFDGTAEKIEKGKLYKIHICRAIALKPDDAVCHYLHGRWFFRSSWLSYCPHFRCLVIPDFQKLRWCAFLRICHRTNSLASNPAPSPWCWCKRVPRRGQP
jgi:hypothetical protein